MQSSHPRSRDQYTVGWIAALDCELTAAMSMLDEKHDQPHDFERGPSDDNVYVWGEINKHNIVIACLKAGIYGTTSAATTAMRLISAFPNVKFGLMVGTGAGVPQPDNKPDIRLGDVVISKPDGSTGGVYLYDLVKAKSGGYLEAKGFLNAPPGILLKSLVTLRAEHSYNGTDIQRHLDKITPNMKEPDDDSPGFIHQGIENDRLFKPHYPHVVEDDSCGNCDPKELVVRNKRKTTKPRFHYGLIASGNTLVKDAVRRDELNQQILGRCLCLEMEAAGLMNDFPCLVIRGIYNYADSHKNDQWQPYAAVTAAAYARELLHFVPREEVDKAAKATEIMHRISRTLEASHSITVDTNHRVKQAEIKEWLAPTDPESNWATARSQCYSSTGQWFLASQEFARWKEQPGSFLWLHGRTGCGKTILSSTIIDHLRHAEQPSSSKNAILFYYFDFKDSSKRSTSNFIRTLLVQLSAASHDSWKELDELREFHRISQPSDSDLIKTFQSISASFDHIMIVLDALDEAMESERADLIQKVIGILKTPSANIHLIATSRRENDIERALDAVKPVAVDLTRDDVNEDINRYIRARIRDSENHPKLQQRWVSRPDIQQEIETTLSEKADGMFRWAACQLDAIEDCVDLRTLRNTLKDFPIAFDEIYARMIHKINPNQRDGAVRLLQLLAFAQQPISVSEAVDAYVVDPSQSPAFSEVYRLPVPLEIMQVCGALVTIGRLHGSEELDEQTNLHLAHFSVKQYITSTRLQPEYLQPQFDPVRAHSSITRICLSYMESVLAEVNPYYQDFDMLCDQFPFLRYASTCWTIHAKNGEDDEDLFNIIHHFFQHPNAYRVWAAFFVGNNFDRSFASDGKMSRLTPPPIHVCMYARLTKTTLKLMNLSEYLEPQSPLCEDYMVMRYPFTGHDDSGNFSFASPLYVASCIGEQTIIRNLIARGAQVHEKCGSLGSALDIACQNQDTETVETILSHGSVPAEIYPQYIQSAMERLVYWKHRHTEFIKSNQSYTGTMSKLLVICEQLNICLDTALLGALSIPDLAIAQTFIKKGASCLAVGKQIEMLEHLSSHELSSIREFLRQNNMEHSLFKSIIELEEKGHEWGSGPCGILARCPNEELFALVLGLPLSTERPSTWEGSSETPRPDPLHREILHNGRKPCQSFTNAPYYGGSTPLMVWAEKGRVHLVELLLRGGADINATDENGNTSSHYAAANDRSEISEVLARYKADLDIKNEDGKTSHTTAVYRRKRFRARGVVQMLWSGSWLNINRTRGTMDGGS